MANKRAKREKRTGSCSENARRRAREHRSFESPTLNVPSNVQLFYLKDDKTRRLDILEYIAGEGNPFADAGTSHYERTYHVHKGLGASGKIWTVCTNKTFGKKCAVCDYLAKASRDPDADQDALKKLQTQERQIFNLIDLAEPEKGVQIWEVAFNSFGRKLDGKIREQDPDDHYDRFANWKGGRTLKMTVADKGEFGFQPDDIEFKSRKDYKESKIKNKVHCLDDIIKHPTYQEQQALLEGLDEDSDENKNSKVKRIKKAMKNLSEMSLKEMKRLVAMLELDIDLDKVKDEEKLRKAIKKELAAALEEAEKSEGKKKSKKDEEDDDDDDDDD